MGRLENKIAIITGGSSGIGREAALLMAGEGATVIAVGRRQGPLDEVVDEIEAAAGSVSRVRSICSTGTLRPSWVPGRRPNSAESTSWSTTPDIPATVRSIRYVQPEEWDEVFTINVGAVYRLTQSAPSGDDRTGRGHHHHGLQHGSPESWSIGRGPVLSREGGRADHYEIHQQRTAQHGCQGEYHHPGRGKHSASRQAGR